MVHSVWSFLCDLWELSFSPFSPFPICISKYYLFVKWTNLQFQYYFNIMSRSVWNVITAIICLLFRVDFTIPDMEKVGGFSVCSSPGLLHRERCIDLAVKYTEHPPAHWIHTKVSSNLSCFCKVAVMEKFCSFINPKYNLKIYSYLVILLNWNKCIGTRLVLYLQLTPKLLCQRHLL